MTLRDVIYLAGAGFLTLFLGLVIYHFVFSQIGQQLILSPAVNQSDVAVDVLTQGQIIINNYDRLAIAGFFAIFLVFIVTSWFTHSYPILIPFYLLGGIGAVIIAMFTSNFWEEITQGSEFVTSLTYFPFADHIMLNLPVYTAIFFVIGIIIIFAKPGGSDYAE